MTGLSAGTDDTDNLFGLLCFFGIFSQRFSNNGSTGDLTGRLLKSGTGRTGYSWVPLRLLDEVQRNRALRDLRRASSQICRVVLYPIPGNLDALIRS